MNTFLSYLGFFTIGSVSITAVIGFIMKQIFDYYLKKRMNRYQNKLEKEIETLKNDFSTQLESFKLYINKLSFEHQIKYTNLFNERAKIIKELFIKLVELQSGIESLINVFKTTDNISRVEKKNIFIKDFNKFITFFSLNEIFLEEEITNLLNILKEEYLKIWADLSLIPAFKNPEEKFVNLDPDKVRLWKDIWVRVKEYIPPIKDKLKKEFQKALGFSKNE